MQSAPFFLQDISFYKIMLEVLISLLNQCGGKKYWECYKHRLWFYLWTLYQNGVVYSFLPFSKLLPFAFLITIVFNCWITFYMYYGIRLYVLIQVGKIINKIWNIFKTKVLLLIVTESKLDKRKSHFQS